MVCRQLGFFGGISTQCCDSHQEGTGLVLLGNVNCLGEESSFLECDNGGLNRSRCLHGQDVGVRCDRTQPDQYGKMITVVYLIYDISFRF